MKALSERKWWQAAAFALFVMTLTNITSVASADRVPELGDFLARDRFTAMKISPDGRHFAATVPEEGRTSLVILSRAELAVTARVAVDPGQHISAFDWANDRQVVYSRHHKDGSRAPELGSGGLYKVSVDGSDAGQLGLANVALLDTLPDDDDHVLVYGFMSVAGSPIVRMELATGDVESWPLSAPRGGNFFFYFNDNAGQVRLADGSERVARKQRLFVNDPDPDWRAGQKTKNRRWHRVNFEDETGEFWDFLGFSGDNLTAYFQVEKAVSVPAWWLTSCPPGSAGSSWRFRWPPWAGRSGRRWIAAWWRGSRSTASRCCTLLRPRIPSWRRSSSWQRASRALSRRPLRLPGTVDTA